MAKKKDCPIYIGVAGWSYPDWKGIVYTSTKTDQLEYISKYVDCVEINNTFYRPPAEHTSELWLRKTQARPEFFFTAKLNRDFTHEGRIDSAIVKEFHKGFEPMLKAGKLRQLLAQFKYDFEDNEQSRKHLDGIVKNFKDAIPPGDERLFRMAIDLAPQCKPPTKEELAELARLTETYKVIL